jgi:hypothetical protein
LRQMTLPGKRIPRSSSGRPLNLEPISNKCITQFHQAWSIICSYFDTSTQHRVDQSQEIETAKANSDLIRTLYELDLMGIRGNKSDQDVRKAYEDQLLEPDKFKQDQSSKFGSSATGLTNYNNQSKRLYKAATALKSTVELSRFIIGYFRGLHNNFQKQHLHSIVNTFKSLQEAIDYVNKSAIGLQQMNQGNWEEPPTHSYNVAGNKREAFFRNSRSSSSSPSYNSSNTASSSGGGSRYPSNGTSATSVMHTLVEDDKEEEEDDLKRFIETTIAKSFEVYAMSTSGGGHRVENCSQWMNTGKCWRVDHLAKNPSMEPHLRCRYKHPDLNTFTPPFK